VIPIDNETFAVCLAIATEMEGVCTQMRVPEHRWTRVRQDLEAAQSRSALGILNIEAPALCRRMAG
jgi:hypothetical protein